PLILSLLPYTTLFRSHEFAHKIHMDGAGDADFPAARAGMDAAEWRRILEEAYERFCSEVDSGRPTFIDEYAAEHPAEFFAVMSEDRKSTRLNSSHVAN